MDGESSQLEYETYDIIIALLLSCISPFFVVFLCIEVVVHSVGIGSALAEMDLGK